MDEHARQAATERQRRRRAKIRAEAVLQDLSPEDVDGVEKDDQPEVAPQLIEEQARLTLARRRLVQLEFRRRSGQLIEVAAAQAQINALAIAIRRQLDLAQAYLRSDLQPEVREAAVAAMQEAIGRAMSELDRARPA